MRHKRFERAKKRQSLSRGRVLTRLNSLLGALLLVPALFLLGPNLLEEVPVRELGSFVAASRDNPLRLLFVGDIMLDRDIRRLGETVGYAALLEDVMPQLERYDWVVGNLEGPITNHASVSRGSAVGSLDNTRFTFAPEVADFLYTANIRLLHIGNNHIFDFGREGVLSTARTLTQHHLLYFGDVRGRSSSVIYVKKENLTVGLVSYNQFLGNGVEQALSNVEEARANADLVVLITHWGDEYEREPSREMRALARRFVDRGADIIVGTHPHVVIPPEVYNGAPIYYSLGNFIFDQYWEKTVRCGLALSVYVNRDGSFAHETASTSFSGGKVAWGSCL